MNFLFYVSAISVLPFWFMMICLPKLKLTQSVIKSPWIIVIPALCYAALFIPHFSIQSTVMVFSNASPKLLSQVFSAPWSASMMWAHVGAFDLFVGRWIFLDSRERNISHCLIVTPLFVSIFYGPIGFLLYGAIRILALRFNRDEFKSA